jgi:mannose-6-phosphate isomerase-like protein (cupin superfamily)
MRAFISVLVLVVSAYGAGLAMSPSDATVTYIAAADVKAAFDKGAVLLNNGRYQVHASRREAPGQAEVHLEDTDIIYLLEGTTTFVTGGTVVGGTTTAPGEIRGADIRGGQARTLTRGDVIVVPRGTPHWFKDVKGPVLYYVVKVQ